MDPRIAARVRLAVIVVLFVALVALTGRTRETMVSEEARRLHEESSEVFGGGREGRSFGAFRSGTGNQNPVVHSRLREAFQKKKLTPGAVQQVLDAYA